MGVVAQLVTRLLLEEDLEFTAQVAPKYVDVYGPPEAVRSDLYGPVSVTWALDLEMRSWGVKEVAISVRRLTAQIEHEDEASGRTWTDDINWSAAAATAPPHNPEAGPKELVMHHLESRWNVEVKWDDRRWSEGLSVRGVEIDYPHREITVLFQ